MAITPDEQPYIQTLASDWYEGKVAEVSMLRLDVIHKDVSGNKWYKLKYNIAYCQQQGVNTILTFGGAYSNHLSATAAMAKLSGLRSIGIVKGKYAEKELTPTLQFCIDNGMQLHFVSNESYSRKNDADFLKELSIIYGQPLIIPEGGANDMGIAGAGEIVSLIPAEYDHIAVSVGTGSTLSGILNNVKDGIKVSGFAPMKGGRYLAEEVLRWVHPLKSDSIEVFDNWHFGGFGKHTEELIVFMNGFYGQHNIPLDMVYTAKMMYGLREQILQGVYPASAKILCIHTGGLQGNQSIAEKLVF